MMHRQPARQDAIMPRSAAACLLAALLLVIGGAGIAGNDVGGDVPHIRNTDVPAAGTATLELTEKWRVGGDDAEVLFGAIGNVVTDGDGNLYLLDRQLCEVQVFSGEGEYVRTLAGEGEGPGEVRMPRDLLFLPDGNVGILQMMPGKIVKVDREGTPAGSIRLGGGDPTGGGMSALFSAAFRGGTFVVVGDQMRPGNGVLTNTRYLATISGDGEEQARMLETTRERNMANFKWNEVEDYFVHMGGMAVGPDGRIYAAPERDRYVVHVYSPDGELERVIERDDEPRKRTQEEKDVVNDTRRMVINGREIEKEIGDHAPSISRLWVDDDGQLWVAHSRSEQDQPAGTFATYDVFDRDGRFARQVAVACPGDPEQDRLILLDGGRAVMVTDFTSAAIAMVGARGDGGGEAVDAVPLEVIVYDIAD